jgi:hypothetical protein
VRQAKRRDTGATTETLPAEAASTSCKPNSAPIGEMADALNGAGAGGPDRALLMEIQKRHGITPALPAS